MYRHYTLRGFLGKKTVAWSSSAKNSKPSRREPVAWHQSWTARISLRDREKHTPACSNEKHAPASSARRTVATGATCQQLTTPAKRSTGRIILFRLKENVWDYAMASGRTYGTSFESRKLARCFFLHSLISNFIKFHAYIWTHIILQLLHLFSHHVSHTEFTIFYYS